MTGEVCQLLRACVADKHPDDHVFTRENGEPVQDFRGAWWALCEKAGLGRFVRVKDRKGRVRDKWQGLLFHDLRRSAARNMVRYGVDEGVVMKIGGWKTRAVFERYNIVSESDITEVASKIEEGRRRSAAKLAKPSATTSATASKRSSAIDGAIAS
jgi:integrase